MSTEFKRVTKVSLPFDMRHEEPKKNYGIHGLDVFYVLEGPKGAVQFAASFPIYLPHIERYERPTWLASKWNTEPVGIDVGYHSPKPMYEGQLSMECEHVESGTCYYDGSGLCAKLWVDELFSIRGERIEPKLWAKLEQEYRDRFEK